MPRCRKLSLWRARQKINRRAKPSRDQSAWRDKQHEGCQPPLARSNEDKKMGIRNRCDEIEIKSSHGKESALIFLSTGLAMVAFAANSLLARMAFQTTSIDASSFTFIRITSGALTLFVVLQFQERKPHQSKVGWISAALLFIYAAAFSFAYRDISTGAGALVLFAAAQLLMISYGIYKGEKTSVLGMLMALGGLIAFLAPSASASAPATGPAALMAIAGLAWGAFSLLGRASDSPIIGTATSFIWAVPLALALLAFQRHHIALDRAGIMYAALSGTLASAIGYAIWYWVRVRMTTISAGAVQLCVPVLSAVMGMVLLDEQMTLKGAISGLVALGGIVLITLTVKRK